MKPLVLPIMDYSFTQRVIQAFILAEAEKYRFKGAVIALSGGLDSCLTAVLTHQALNGKISLIYMPYGEHPSSQHDAQALAEFLQTPMEHFDIKTTADSLFQGRNIQDPKRKGNVLARLRMNILFDLSARDHLMVVGTSNKSEMLTGYSTWYGDSAAGIMPLGDLYKTQVRGLATYCQLPESILHKAPSAELWEGQTDEGEMGISYPELDAILYHWIDLRRSPEELVQMGFNEQLVQKTISLARKALFKHKLPIICKLSDRTIGLDYRLNKECMNLR
jgi:NAD+ synthase